MNVDEGTLQNLLVIGVERYILRIQAGVCNIW